MSSTFAFGKHKRKHWKQDKTYWRGRAPGRRRNDRGRSRIRARFNLSRYGGLLALAFVAGLAAYQYLIPIPGPITASSAGRTFSICGGGARINCVVDGDTFYFAGEKIRIADIDTPEVFSPQCRREKMLGDKATRRLHALLNAGPIQLRAVERNRDVYGRLLRTVHRDGRSLGTVLVAEGLAHRWRGYKETWCS